MPVRHYIMSSSQLIAIRVLVIDLFFVQDKRSVSKKRDKRKIIAKTVKNVRDGFLFFSRNDVLDIRKIYVWSNHRHRHLILFYRHRRGRRRVCIRSMGRFFFFFLKRFRFEKDFWNRSRNCHLKMTPVPPAVGKKISSYVTDQTCEKKTPYYTRDNTTLLNYFIF